MKESENSIWKEEILKDFRVPTQAGFDEKVMGLIEELENKPVVKPAPLVSLKQWFYTILVASLVVLMAVFVQYKIELDFGFLETYSFQLLDWINAHMGTLWTLFSLVGVFFVFTLFNQKRLIYK